ncbi:YusW family protein [Halalkalibacterium halodurans]|uniref:BH2989 protein n=1 Tax=Halalkalibacterium halodurans (strain ATCC BAA-125 / DSM 18197 / FERM 7344 / JCM 9153 / C-125) TaxID=272558 RepID=Q9K8L7_HALH5|nr:YusW family protein [Halalkalibacterium halodurans]MED4082805.1 YusW family protein [Halalkalibacterium halodurans]MED4085964.1 YusW family protein [Halalkalibacterium halodurans]MED4103152.1 YusW family protein [Halalkalibacterium halodurans]MED4109488.1 YusW family protein [Halalkalibacterium halodurans]MED4123137.1 YusW family protein [Halalkalibacterium halodurans]
MKWMLKSFVLLLGFSCFFISMNQSISYATPSIIDFELEMVLKDYSTYDIEYEMSENVLDATYNVPNEPTIKGQEAVEKVQSFIGTLQLLPSTSNMQAVQNVLTQLQLSKDDIHFFKLEATFDGGATLNIHWAGKNCCCNDCQHNNERD